MTEEISTYAKVYGTFKSTVSKKCAAKYQKKARGFGCDCQGSIQGKEEGVVGPRSA